MSQYTAIANVPMFIWLLGEEPQKEHLLCIEHGGERIRIKNTVAANWREFAIFLHLNEGNDLDAEFDGCFRDPLRMAVRVFDLYLANERDLNPTVNPSWKEILEALKKMKQNELVKKLEVYFLSEATRLVMSAGQQDAGSQQVPEAMDAQQWSKLALPKFAFMNPVQNTFRRSKLKCTCNAY